MTQKKKIEVIEREWYLEKKKNEVSFGIKIGVQNYFEITIYFRCDEKKSYLRKLEACQ